MPLDGDKWGTAELLSVWSQVVAAGPRRVLWSRRFLLDYPDDYTGDIPARRGYAEKFIASLHPAT